MRRTWAVICIVLALVCVVLAAVAVRDRQTASKLEARLRQAEADQQTIRDQLSRLRSATPAASPAPEPDVLPDGRQFGFVRSVSASSKTMQFDLAEFLTGKAAQTAAAEDGTTVENDYYIRNRNPKMRMLPIDPSAKVILSTYRTEETASNSPAPETLATFEGFYTSSDQRSKRMRDTPYWLTVTGGEVVRIEEQFVP